MPEPHDAILAVIGQRLQETRKLRGLTQQELAERLSVEPATLSRYETGARPISLALLSKAAEELGVRLVYLVGDQPQPGDEPGLEDLLAAWRALDAERRELAVRLVRELGIQGVGTTR
jgi:transcriptional regulator with XRE-family HTH domain